MPRGSQLHRSSQHNLDRPAFSKQPHCRGVTLDQLTIMRSFVGVTKSRSFSQAARQLGISGSLVSRHVAELERSLGVHLVTRTARPIRLPEAGSRYAEFAARIIDEIDREEAQLRGLRDKPEGQLAVISPKWIGSNDVGDAIVAF